MKKYKLLACFILLVPFLLNSCKKFLDVVPDNVATLDNAFKNRHEAEKFLFTCYSYMPKNGDLADDPGMLAGDEIWRFESAKGFMEVARGFQNSVTPLGDRWQYYYQGIRNCNIFLENIDKVPDIDETEKRRWIAETKFLKAYYHFYLMKMYGPVPLMKQNLAIDAGENQVEVSRAPMDSCFNYVVQLINEAAGDLPLTIDNPTKELGRLTQPIALAIKAEVLVYEASPLFNGNADMSTLKNHDGTPLFNAVYSKAKWDSAAVACKQAIDLCHQVGMELYKYNPDFQQYSLSDTIKTQLSIRNSVCERWNSEVIWANTQTNSTSLQKLMTPFWDPDNLDITTIHGELSPPLKIAELFYTSNGVPISEDKTWNYNKRYSLKTAGSNDKLYVRQGYTTAQLNLDREPRFYADLGFDGSVWYGQGMYDDKKPLDLFYLMAKYRQRNGYGKPGFGTVTGYFIKKLIHYENVIDKKGNGYSVTAYPFIIMRLADLYLLYAEALNESEGPGNEVYDYVNKVRQRAGLPTVQTSWDLYSINGSKYTTPNGMRDIIHQERLIELAFEGKRFWDLRRWKEAATQLNMPVKGWDLQQEDAAYYYRPSVLYNQTFGLKDYFWPIRTSALSMNGNLVQNIGW
ncbi:RagB/SusD family nutrient uptake outer membrane protein [Pedobacter sp. BS3]|uniref:RagB/SusD family nutrient uptake outer membrane protein n=1 Tax=Pedobacter sp. BS3 TaxID=2567937 RepID=UPI0011EFD567|nr:RagB/SusD family nutrient uptake outer membrane protein [Pedobacter sp. BS3]TZF82820.1 RagB/SusD family nutrient uptake outer membrane protein [Pedobacter sp. BS3]